MPPLLSIDLRNRIIHWRIREGRTVSEVAALAGCGERVVKSITCLYLETGEFSNGTAHTMGRPRILTMSDKSYIRSVLQEKPSLYLDEIQDMLWFNREIDVCLSTLSRTLREMAITNKTVSYEALQRNNLLRATWIGAYGDIPMDYMVFLDESGIESDDHQRTNGWGLLGSACTRRAIWMQGERFSILPALTHEGIVSMEIFRGAVNRDLFIGYIQEHLASEPDLNYISFLKKRCRLPF